MKGSNEIQINKATMNEAIEWWLGENVLRDSIEFRVSAVEYDDRSGFFIVKLEEPQENPSAK